MQHVCRLSSFLFMQLLTCLSDLTLSLSLSIFFLSLSLSLSHCLSHTVTLTLFLSHTVILTHPLTMSHTRGHSCSVPHSHSLTLSPRPHPLSSHSLSLSLTLTLSISLLSLYRADEQQCWLKSSIKGLTAVMDKDCTSGATDLRENGDEHITSSSQEITGLFGGDCIQWPLQIIAQDVISALQPCIDG